MAERSSSKRELIDTGRNKMLEARRAGAVQGDGRREPIATGRSPHHC